MTHSVSFLISTNSSNGLMDTVMSCLLQSYQDYEIVIVCDTNDAHVVGMCNSLALNIDKIRVIENKKNIGLTASLNVGLRTIKSRYCARVDAGDVNNFNRLEEQIKLIEKTGSSCVFANFSVCLSDKQPVFYSNLEQREYSIEDLRRGNIFAHSTAMFKVEDVRELGGFDELFFYRQDYDLWRRLMSSGKMVYCSSCNLVSLVPSKNGISLGSIAPYIFGMQIKTELKKNRLGRFLSTLFFYPLVGTDYIRAICRWHLYRARSK